MAFNRNNNVNMRPGWGNIGTNSVANIVVVPAQLNATTTANVYGALNFVPKYQESYEAFLAVDTDRSGAIDWRELQTALQKSFGTPGRPFPGSIARNLIRAFDDDQSGSLQYDEFEELYKEIESWKSIFYSAVRNKQNYLTMEQMKKVWDSLEMGLSDVAKDLVLESLLPDDNTDRIQWTDFIRILAELKAIVKFVEGNMAADGTVTLNPETFVLGFYTCRA